MVIACAIWMWRKPRRRPSSRPQASLKPELAVCDRGDSVVRSAAQGVAPMSAVSANMAVGTEFAGYRITGMLGRGGMSTVYAAEHIRLGRPAALKGLSPALPAHAAFR